MTFTYKNVLSKLSYLFLVLIILLPQGVGYRPYYKALSIDGPRTFILLTIIIASILFIKNILHQSLKPLNRSYFYFILFSALTLISAFNSENTSSSLFLSIKLLTIWVVFACSFDYINSQISNDQYFLNCLFIILSGLLVYCIIEFFLQTHAIPSWTRTSFSNFDDYSLVNNRIITRNGLILTQGPFTWNHGFGGVICCLLGVTLYTLEKHKVLGIILTTLFFLAVLTNGMRAVFIAITFGLLIWMVYRFNINKIIVLFICMLLASGIYATKANPKNILFYDTDINIQNEYHLNGFKALFLNQEKKFNRERTSNFLAQFLPYSSEEIGDYVVSKGTLGIRFIGLIENLLNYKSWWLTGYGVGSFQKPDIIKSSAYQYNDPGLIMLLLFELGLLPFLVIMYLVIKSFFISMKNRDWMLGIGISSWFVFSLSSMEIWPMLIITLFITKIFR